MEVYNIEKNDGWELQSLNKSNSFLLPICVDEQSVGSETYGFDAIRGVQAGREFYVAMCPLKIIPKLFIFNDYDIPLFCDL